MARSQCTTEWTSKQTNLQHSLLRSLLKPRRYEQRLSQRETTISWTAHSSSSLWLGISNRKPWAMTVSTFTGYNWAAWADRPSCEHHQELHDAVNSSKLLNIASSVRDGMDCVLEEERTSGGRHIVRIVKFAVGVRWIARVSTEEIRIREASASEESFSKNHSSDDVSTEEGGQQQDSNKDKINHESLTNMEAQGVQTAQGQVSSEYGSEDDNLASSGVTVVSLTIRTSSRLPPGGLWRNEPLYRYPGSTGTMNQTMSQLARNYWRSASRGTLAWISLGVLKFHNNSR